jgi:hypothetical protein
MATVEGPDFICIGMPKAGTAWLFDQLKFHPDFWLPPVKELGYLSRSKPRLKSARKIHERGKANPERYRERRRRNRKSWKDRDFQFLDEVVELAEKDRDIARYATLFRHKGDQKSGDITPGYNLMSENIIAEIAGQLPDVKVIYLIREPIARLWSHVNLFYGDDKFDAGLLEDVDAFADYLDGHNTLLAHSKPTQTLERWRKAGPSLQFRHFFFDDIARAPEKTRREILEFIGADPDKPSADLPPGFNRKSGKATLVLPDKIRAVIRDRLADEVRACASVLGGPARDWPALYGL